MSSSGSASPDDRILPTAPPSDLVFRRDFGQGQEATRRTVLTLNGSLTVASLDITGVMRELLGEVHGDELAEPSSAQDTSTSASIDALEDSTADLTARLPVRIAKMSTPITAKKISRGHQHFAKLTWTAANTFDRIEVGCSKSAKLGFGFDAISRDDRAAKASSGSFGTLPPTAYPAGSDTSEAETVFESPKSSGRYADSKTASGVNKSVTSCGDTSTNTSKASLVGSKKLEGDCNGLGSSFHHGKPTQPSTATTETKKNAVDVARKLLKQDHGYSKGSQEDEDEYKQVIRKCQAKKKAIKVAKVLVKKDVQLLEKRQQDLEDDKKNVRMWQAQVAHALSKRELAVHSREMAAHDREQVIETKVGIIDTLTELLMAVEDQEQFEDFRERFLPVLKPVIKLFSSIKEHNAVCDNTKSSTQATHSPAIVRGETAKPAMCRFTFDSEPDILDQHSIDCSDTSLDDLPLTIYPAASDTSEPSSEDDLPPPEVSFAGSDTNDYNAGDDMTVSNSSSENATTSYAMQKNCEALEAFRSGLSPCFYSSESSHASSPQSTGFRTRFGEDVEKDSNHQTAFIFRAGTQRVNSRTHNGPGAHLPLLAGLTLAPASLSAPYDMSSWGRVTLEGLSTPTSSTPAQPPGLEGMAGAYPPSYHEDHQEKLARQEIDADDEADSSEDSSSAGYWSGEEHSSDKDD